MKTIEDLRKHLAGCFDDLDVTCQCADYYDEESAAETAEECQRLAARFGWQPVGDEKTMSPRKALGIVGQLLRWSEEQCPYLDSSRAANYLGITEQSLYGLVERKRLVPLRGPRRTYRFTRQQLDDYLENSNV